MRAGGGGSSSIGLYGVLAIIAIAGPFLRYFWKDKRASLAGLLPLLFMIAVSLMIRSSINSIGGDGTGNPMVTQMREEAMKAISMGMGVYLSVTVSAYFAAIGARQYLVGRSGDHQQSAQSYKAAA